MTAKKTTAGKAEKELNTEPKASTRQDGAKTASAPESGNPRDRKHPDIDDSRHDGSGLQELTTAPGGVASVDASTNAEQGSGMVPGFIDPQPSIGVAHTDNDHQDGPVDVSELEEVTNYAQAAALPVLTGDDAKGAKPYKPKAENAITAFKDENRRTMLVVAVPGAKGKKGSFAAVPKEA